VENYNGVIPSLTPLRSERETKGNEAKTDDHIPRTNVWDWIRGSADVVDNDPD
jgi:hypothetical protein